MLNSLRTTLIVWVCLCLSACNEQKRVFEESAGDWICVAVYSDNEGSSDHSANLINGSLIRIGQGEFTQLSTGNLMYAGESKYSINPLVIQIDHKDIKFEDKEITSRCRLAGANMLWAHMAERPAKDESRCKYVFDNENGKLSIEKSTVKIEAVVDFLEGVVGFEEVAGPSKIECRRASIGDLLTDAQTSFDLERKRSPKVSKILREEWFNLAATLRSDGDACPKIKSMLTNSRDQPDFVKMANIRVAKNLMSVTSCQLDDDEIDPLKLLAEIGIQPILPEGWRERFYAEGLRSGIARFQAKLIMPGQTTNAGGPSDVDAPRHNPMSIESKDPEGATAPASVVEASQSLPRAPGSPLPSATHRGNAMESASEPPATIDCSADSPQAQAPEERKLLANENRRLTGRSLRVGTRGDVFVVEAALGYDGMCRPSPYQIYVFNHGDQVGTLSPAAMTARTDGAIVGFSQLDEENLQIEVSRYGPSDPACCPSSIERRVIPLSQFGIDRASTDDPSARKLEPAGDHEFAASVTAPSFDCADARSDVENAICSDIDLRRLDGELGRAYSHLLHKLGSDERSVLRAEQRRWIHQREQVCGAVVSCLRDALQARLDTLSTWAPRGGLH